MQQEILKVSDVAELLQMTPWQILKLCKSDAKTPIPHIRINGRSLRFRRSDVEAWFSKNLQNTIVVV